MKRLLIALTLITATLVSFSPAFAGNEKPNIFVVVTSADAQTQGMAMVLSIHARKQGAKVQVLLCGPGGDLALKGSPQTVLKPKGMTPQKLMAKLMTMGVQPQVCAIYLPNKGKSNIDLIAGVTVAKPPAIAATMLAEDTRLFTF